jgi:hypothetical protein
MSDQVGYRYRDWASFMSGRYTPECYQGDSERIEALCASDRSFNDLWADYCEIVSLLEASAAPGEELVELGSQLEVEIDEALGVSHH